MTQRSKLLAMLTVFAFAGLAVWLVASAKTGRRPVDVNSATFEQLDAVPYLTPDAARGIIAGRPFESVDELLDVSGIGEKTLEKIRKYVRARR